MTYTNRYIPGFDGLRAVSVLLVVMNHAGIQDLLPDGDFWQVHFWRLICGETGVMVFFVLSGFLITRLLLTEKAEKGKIDVLKFFGRRFLRLMPALFMFLLVITVLHQTGIVNVNSRAFLAAMFYFYNFLPQEFNVVELTHTWSLAVEEQFYLIWPFLIRFCPARIFPVVLLFLLFAGLLFLIALPGIRIGTANGEVLLTEAYRPMRWLLPAAIPILFGALFAWKSFGQHRPIALFSLKNAWLIGGLLFLSPLFAEISVMHLTWFSQSLGVSFMLAGIYYAPTSLLTQILEWKPLRFTGQLSYGIYIWQGLFLRTGPGSEHWFQSFPQNMVLSLFAALLSYFLVERYFLKLKEKLR